MPASIDLVGQRFGLLTVERVEPLRGRRAWRCRCDCGGSVVVATGALRSGNSKSCGCRKRSVLGESTITHGGCGTPTYGSWKAMHSRCRSHPRYVGRIKVCARWDSFENFLADMGERPKGTSLDRWPDNHGNYEPGNCRWATPIEQGRNTRQNRVIEHEGETLTLSAWAERLGVKSDVLWKRLKKKGSL